MNQVFCDPLAEDKIWANFENLRSFDYRHAPDIKSFTIMDALVEGQTCSEDCERDGWPDWLPDLLNRLFRCNNSNSSFPSLSSYNDEQSRKRFFCLKLARAISVPFNHEKARIRFLQHLVSEGHYSALKLLSSLRGEINDTIKLAEDTREALKKALTGEDITSIVQGFRIRELKEPSKKIDGLPDGMLRYALVFKPVDVMEYLGNCYGYASRAPSYALSPPITEVDIREACKGYLLSSIIASR